ncbi:MAG: NADH-quinone oxidoreductase subunit A [bacterium]
MVAVGLLFFLQSLISPKKPSVTKLSAYECGAEAIGDARIRFHSRFYLYAVLFIIFEVELAFLFPWATAFRRGALGGIPLPLYLEMAVFVLILFIGLVYAWREGVLKWE